MIITENFKQKLRTIKKIGYQRVYSIGGTYYDTDYCTFWEINYLLSLPIGTALKAYKANSLQRWEGQTNTRHIKATDIQYRRLMSIVSKAID